MIKKSDVAQSERMMSVAEAEHKIDSGLRAAPIATTTFNLHPIDEATVREVAKRYEGGGWSVRVDPLRMPNGYCVRLS